MVHRRRTGGAHDFAACMKRRTDEGGGQGNLRRELELYCAGEDGNWGKEVTREKERGMEVHVNKRVGGVDVG